MIRTFLKTALCLTWLTASGLSASAQNLFADTTHAYAIPTLSKTPTGTVALSWTEKEANGVTSFYWAESKDQGKTFGQKHLIVASEGVSGSRLMRPKLHFKKDGTPVAVFALRGPAPAAAPQAPATAEHNHGAAATTAAPKQGAPRGGGRPGDLQIAYVTSGDGGYTWSAPKPVHTDQTPNTVRGFFDSVVMANGEIGVAYLNDIPGKPHERDLRFVTSTGQNFGQERVLDNFTCDCCNISLLVDKDGGLNMYYRDNQDNIRDIARMRSTDNGQTFSKTEMLYHDNWKINGCPHSGPTSVAQANTNLIAWYSGTQEQPGIRVVNQQGNRLFVVEDPSAKNPYLTGNANNAVLLWEQNLTAEDSPTSVIAYRPIGSPAAKTLTQPNATTASGLVMDKTLIIAYEIKGKTPGKNSIGFTTVSL